MCAGRRSTPAAGLSAHNMSGSVASDETSAAGSAVASQFPDQAAHVRPCGRVMQDPWRCQTHDAPVDPGCPAVNGWAQIFYEQSFHEPSPMGGSDGSAPKWLSDPAMYWPVCDGDVKVGHGSTSNKSVTGKGCTGGGEKTGPGSPLGGSRSEAGTMPNDSPPRWMFTRTGDCWPQHDAAAYDRPRNTRGCLQRGRPFDAGALSMRTGAELRWTRVTRGVRPSRYIERHVAALRWRP